MAHGPSNHSPIGFHRRWVSQSAIHRVSFNYLLQVKPSVPLASNSLFIPMESIRIAGDKRLVAAAFTEHRVPSPVTRLIDNFSEVHRFIEMNAASGWCLKYPTGCGANGHRMLTENDAEPRNWPRPFIVQEFIRMDHPEVYRTYCAGGELFGWVVRRFPEGARSSPWVAHARGARYVHLDYPPSAACEAARAALKATGLYDSFGCADLLCRPSGEWVVLEVGTDGLYNHVDRELGNSRFEQEIHSRIAKAFWRSATRTT